MIMRKTYFGIMAALVAAMGLATRPVMAVEAGQLELGGGTGFSIPMNDNLDDYDNSFYLGGQGYYHLDSMLSVGAELGYSFGHSYDNGPVEADLSVLHLTPQIRLATRRSAANGRSFSPYAIAGLGLYQTQTDVKVNAGPFTTESDDDETDMGINLGAGINLETSRSFVIGVDVRYHQIFNQGQDAKFLIPTLRLSYFY